jgi:hypothetical protein
MKVRAIPSRVSAAPVRSDAATLLIDPMERAAKLRGCLRVGCGSIGHDPTAFR